MLSYLMTVTAEQAETLGELIDQIDLSQYSEILNPESWTNMNMESIIVVSLVLIAAYKLFGKAYKFVWWCIGLLFMIQICYLLGLSDLNNYIPFSSFFKYDIGVSIANFFSGTRIAAGILWVHDVLHVSVVYTGNVIAKYGSEILNRIDSFIRNNPVSEQ